jgi:hypothetical protein
MNLQSMYDQAQMAIAAGDPGGKPLNPQQRYNLRQVIMNWTEILAKAGIPEPLGRDEAIRAARLATDRRYEATGGPKPARGTNSRPVQQVSRKVLQDRERKGRSA